MHRRLRHRRSLGLLAAGMGLGLLVGIGMMIGVLTGVRHARTELTFPEIPVQATASHGGDTFAMATGFISDGVEGVFFLDYLTGDLQCWVLNRRNGALGGMFKHNVIGDLGIDQGKKPSYLMVTGQANFVRGSGQTRPADSVVYVADANTGRFAAYSLPWNPTAVANNQTQFQPMVLIGTGAARNLTIRE